MVPIYSHSRLLSLTDKEILNIFILQTRQMIARRYIRKKSICLPNAISPVQLIQVKGEETKQEKKPRKKGKRPEIFFLRKQFGTFIHVAFSKHNVPYRVH